MQARGDTPKAAPRRRQTAFSQPEGPSRTVPLAWARPFEWSNAPLPATPLLPQRSLHNAPQAPGAAEQAHARLDSGACARRPASKKTAVNEHRQIFARARRARYGNSQYRGGWASRRGSDEPARSPTGPRPAESRKKRGRQRVKKIRCQAAGPGIGNAHAFRAGRPSRAPKNECGGRPRPRLLSGGPLPCASALRCPPADRMTGPCTS